MKSMPRTPAACPVSPVKQARITVWQAAMFLHFRVLDCGHICLVTKISVDWAFEQGKGGRHMPPCSRPRRDRFRCHLKTRTQSGSPGAKLLVKERKPKGLIGVQSVYRLMFKGVWEVGR